MDRLPRPPDPTGRVLHGFEHNEDAVILRSPPPGMALVQTVDVLAPIGNNPRRFGQTAAANALSDVYAVGGEPWAAMNILAYPASELPLDVAAEILAAIPWKMRKSSTGFPSPESSSPSRWRAMPDLSPAMCLC